MQSPNEQLIQKWGPILEHPDLPKIGDIHRRDVVAALLENTELELRNSPRDWAQTSLLEAGSVPANVTGGGSNPMANYDPILISLVRRAMPNLIAYDICGVQPMTGPTGLIFAMRSRYTSQTGNEAFYYEADTGFSSNTGGTTALGDATRNIGGIYPNTAAGSATANGSLVVSGNSQLYNFAAGMSTANAERLGTDNRADFAQMAFSIEKVTVTAKSRALKAEYTMELAQDLKAIHGLDAETELANILSAEILAEINREVVRSINLTAVAGAQEGTVTAGTFDLDTDSNGRWSVEKFKGLMFQIEREANAIAKQTRRGKGNILVCSSDVASALQMAGILSYTPALNSNSLNVDDTGNTFAGVLNGRIKVYIDPYAAGQYMTVGYKGSNAFDAGIFYCPYVPLQMVRAVGQDTFQPKIGFKTRYGMVANPFAGGSDADGLSAGSQAGVLTQNRNVYYRRVAVNNLF